jgi:hypothetical protein
MQKAYESLGLKPTEHPTSEQVISAMVKQFSRT